MATTDYASFDQNNIFRSVETGIKRAFNYPHIMLIPDTDAHVLVVAHMDNGEKYKVTVEKV